MNPLLMLATAGKVVNMLGPIKSIAEFAIDGFETIQKKQDKKITITQANLLNSNDVDNSLKSLINNVVPTSILHNINDASKDTAATCVVLKESLQEIISIIDAIEKAANKVDKSTSK